MIGDRFFIPGIEGIVLEILRQCVLIVVADVEGPHFVFADGDGLRGSYDAHVALEDGKLGDGWKKFHAEVGGLIELDFFAGEIQRGCVLAQPVDVGHAAGQGDDGDAFAGIAQ